MDIYEDICTVCMDPLPKNTSKFIRYPCCGGGNHVWCNNIRIFANLSQRPEFRKNKCPICNQELKDSIAKIQKHVEEGEAWAQNLLGQKYEDGDGVDQSYQRAKELYELAAKPRGPESDPGPGYAMAQYNLGIMYENGLGLDQSYETASEYYEAAARYYEAAARQEHASAQLNLGLLYGKGQGVEQSDETAREWWMKSAEQGNEKAIIGLQLLDKREGRATPSFTPTPVECAFCYRPHNPPKHKLRPCTGCHRVFYCDKECQTKHWKRERDGHKQRCDKKNSKKKKSSAGGARRKRTKRKYKKRRKKRTRRKRKTRKRKKTKR